ncbi:serine/threonine protein kinase [Mollisia scopiformis]|uniref:Serine/threonine protein kinase n=1 Tax=Mollisia scopiformis TaxID=149040 RepID=A0A132B5R1_MOLSC|nr:serine/threonine protein kinase [Mollisia scopiformis]KUJ07329.1 serine/threonine protein kinase [Mollisia scopiformis]
MESRIVPLYLPKGVDKVIGFGSSSIIGRLDDWTVLKYPRIPGEQWDRFEIEEHIYNALGSHPRIITCFGLDARGLKLEFATMGTVKDRLRHYGSASSVSCKDRLKWSRQASEALAYIHTKNVVHCDVNTRNLLLDKNLDVKLSDFQGIYADSNGGTLYGFALENSKSFLPRSANHSDQKFDLFALGTAIYEIMSGYEPFPDLDGIDNEEEIERRYIKGQFPVLDDVLAGQIIYKCWSLAYNTVDTCVEDLIALEVSGHAETVS